MTRPVEHQPCLFCGGPAGPGHACDGRQGRVEARGTTIAEAMARGPVLRGVGFTAPGTGPHHDGDTYEAEADHVRLNAQTLRVWEAMRGGQWLSLRAISDLTGDPEASVSARLRDLRKTKFGRHVVERQRIGDTGLYLYRVVA